jgi:tricorn protease
MTWSALSPEGDRVLVTARGEIFSVPVEDGVVLPVSGTSGARESWASFSPDGKRVVYVTDGAGEEAIVTADAWGRGEVKTVRPAGTEGWHFWPLYSPDGKRIAWSDHSQTLWVAPADGSSAPRKVDRDEQGEITDYVWSPDGRYLAYSKTDRQDYSSLWIWDAQGQAPRQVTTDTTNDHSPCWDPEGRYLYFVSERGTNPVLGWRDFQVIEARTSRLMMLLLQADGENPFAEDAGIPGAEPPAVEEKKKRKKKRVKEEEPAPGPKSIRIDFDDIASRQIQIPVERGNYGMLDATDGALFYMEVPTTGLKEEAEGGTLRAFDLDEEESVVVMEDAGGYEIALKGDKLLLIKGQTLYVVDAKPQRASLEDARVDLSGMVAEIEPREEWRQMYFEAWRHMRDFYWDSSMAGIDWKAIRDRYATLLPRISTRAELQDLLGELIGELATSHTYVWGGDAPNKVDWVPTGLLGADVVREGDAFKVVHIYRGDPADEVISPLAVPGQVVKEGEYILAVNHRKPAPGEPLLALLEGKASVPVLLTVNSTNSQKGARTVVVTPIYDEKRLRYVDWVRQNREYVEKKSGGKFGYVHIPDMSTDGLVAFETWFYPQLDKEGLVVDVRWNGGGYVSQLLVERLRREVIGFDRSRGGGVYTYPARVLNGPFVVLLNEFAGSDGDIFPKAVQLEELAPVIGTRSWGGIIGIRADKSLVDGGVLTQPEYAGWYPDGGWVVENHGVDPDIVVQNLPQELARGVDAQLDRGLEELTKLHTQDPPIVPNFGPAPNKSRDAFKAELGNK